MKRVRSLCVNFESCVGGGGGGVGDIKYPDLIKNTKQFLLSDGVHLNDLGDDLFLNNLQGGLDFFVLRKGNQFIPTFLCNIDKIDRGSVDWWLPHMWDHCKPARLFRSAHQVN